MKKYLPNHLKLSMIVFNSAIFIVHEVIDEKKLHIDKPPFNNSDILYNHEQVEIKF